MKGIVGAVMSDDAFDEEQDIGSGIQDDDWDNGEDDEVDEDELCVYCGDFPSVKACPDCGELTICGRCKRMGHDTRCARCAWLDNEMPETDDAIDTDELFEDVRDELLHADGISMLLNNE